MRVAAICLGLLLLPAGVKSANTGRSCYRAHIQVMKHLTDPELVWLGLNLYDEQEDFAGAMSLVADRDVPLARVLLGNAGSSVTLCAE